MNAALKILKMQRLWPLWIILGVSLILLPSLGSYGFWEPQEMTIAARGLPPTEAEIAELERKEKAEQKLEEARIAREEKSAKERGEDPSEIQNSSKKKSKRSEKKKAQEPPLRDWLVEKGIGTFGVSELGARLPFFFIALLTALITYFLGMRIRGPRTGLLAVTILVACPLFVFQSRQLNSEMGAMTGGVLLLFAAIGLCSPEKAKRVIWLWFVDALCLFVGLVFGYYSAGFLLGVLTPLAAIALAVTVSAFVDTTKEAAPEKSDTNAFSGSRTHMQFASGIALLAFFGSLAYFVIEVFDWVEATDGEFSIFGNTFHTSNEYQELLAGSWRQEGNLKINFNSLFEQVAFGMFPWVCLAPVAIFKMAQGGSRGTNPLGARMLFAWAALTWVVCTVALRKIGPVQYAAVPALALAMAVWIDELWTARRESREQKQESSSHLAPPLIALFVLFSAIVVAKDIKSFPEIFLGVHLDKSISKFPVDISLHKLVMGLGVLFALLLSSGIYGWYLRNKAFSWQRYKSKPNTPSFFRVLLQGANDLGQVISSAAHRVFGFFGKWGIPGALAMGLVFSFFLAQVWTPRLSTKLSSKATFSVFHNLQQPGNSLGVLGKASAGANFYARGDFESLRGRPQLITFLQKPERVFALVKASELCPIHKEAAKGEFQYYVVDDSNADKVMLSNRMWNDPVSPPEKLHGLMRSFLDQNPLARDIVRKMPEGIQHPLNIQFDDKLELIGIDVPSEVNRGEAFNVRLYYKVLKPIRRNWQVFVHFDGAGARFQGDHWPVNKRCGTNYWQPGDYIIDRFTVEPDGSAKSNTTYQIWTGLFVGSGGNWENMKVTSGKPDDNNRVSVAKIRMR